jgi:hypothetical protein
MELVDCFVDGEIPYVLTYSKPKFDLRKMVNTQKENSF